MSPSIDVTDTDAAVMSSKIRPDHPFSLSERAFALYPPLEKHDAEYPPMQTPAITPSTVDTLSQPYPIKATPVEAETTDDESTSAMSRSTSNLMLSAARCYPPPPHKHGPIVVVSSYSNFDDLAHGPRGIEATRSMRSYRLNLADGALTLLSAVPEGMMHNPAFSRLHPKLNVMYACTESVQQEGQVYALLLNGKNGALEEHCPPIGAGGTSTCYLTVHRGGRRMLLVNYWDSTISTLELTPDGRLGGLIATYDPKEGRQMKARADKHVNHSRNDDAAQAERQGDPHSHAIVLEPTRGAIAYVPDLGMDLVRQFYFDEQTGVVTPCGSIVSGVKVGKRGLGPRYIQFAKDLPTCYVVNELSSQVAVFQYHADVAAAIATANDRAGSPGAKVAAVNAIAAPTLTLVQTVSTVPEAFPSEMNTCGRITIHPSGSFVVTSNRGHDSVCVHRIHRDSTPPGLLTLAGIFHTRGETPRHFQFDSSGQWLLVANQDSNTVAVFAFNTATGQVTYTGNTYACPSPNFVCVWDGA